ncbi:MAG TPA: cytochrome c3 family protein, partial [Polyangiaceae bacterium]|nr:cytochrome c3 family protein [Polyangiaceae bacterium]
MSSRTDESDAAGLPQKAPFPRWANSATAMGGAAILVLMIGAPCLLMAWVRNPPHTGQFERVDQPVAFDHRHHVRDDGIECRYCHYDVARSRSAGLPETELCMGCHSQIWTDSPMLEPVRKSWFEKRPIHWRRV